LRQGSAGNIGQKSNMAMKISEEMLGIPILKSTGWHLMGKIK
jgi:hypothetical protein